MRKFIRCTNLVSALLLAFTANQSFADRNFPGRDKVENSAFSVLEEYSPIVFRSTIPDLVLRQSPNTRLDEPAKVVVKEFEVKTSFGESTCRLFGPGPEAIQIVPNNIWYTKKVCLGYSFDEIEPQLGCRLVQSETNLGNTVYSLTRLKDAHASVRTELLISCPRILDVKDLTKMGISIGNKSVEPDIKLKLRERPIRKVEAPITQEGQT